MHIYAHTYMYVHVYTMHVYVYISIAEINTLIHTFLSAYTVNKNKQTLSDVTTKLCRQ